MTRAIPRPRAALRLAAVALLLALWLPTQAAEPAMRGPLSDFWARVKRDWAKRLTGLNRGPTQTAIWVALVWEGPEGLAIDDLVEQLQEREARRWVRSQITKHRWSEIESRKTERMQALRQNVILLGTPADNALVARALASLPLKVERSRVTVGDRRMEGDDLLVIAIAPNPIDPSRYALVMTGSSPAALLSAGSVPYGDSDYVVFRGSKLLERGFFRWESGRPVVGHVTTTGSFSDHLLWKVAVTKRCRVHYGPSFTSAGQATSHGGLMDAELERAATYLGIRLQEIAPFDLYLYASRDEKVSQTADARLAHLEPASESIHTAEVSADLSLGPAESALGARLLLRRATGRWGPDGERELPGLAVAISLATRDRFEALPLAEWAARSKRDAGYEPMDILLARRPEELESGDLSTLDAAAFVRYLVERDGMDRLAMFYRSARRSDFRSQFREIFGRSLRQAEQEWLEALPSAPATIAARPDRRARAQAPAPEPALAEARAAFERRDDAAAERLLRGAAPSATSLVLLARIQFRTGRFDLAVRTAAEALAVKDASPEDRAWARVTSGRAHARAGRLVTAMSELTQPDVSEGPEPVRVLADYWLEILGQPLNRRAANEILMQEADTDLMGFDWEEAERKLQAVLASDPENQHAHAMLGQVYLSRYQYWHDWLLLDRELFPGTSMADPETYAFLADKGQRELQLAETLPYGPGEKPPPEGGAMDPGYDQATPHFLAGKVHFLRGELESARRQFETSLSLEPRAQSLIAYCHLYLGTIAAWQDDAQRARQHFETVLKIAPVGEATKIARKALADLEPSGSRR